MKPRVQNPHIIQRMLAQEKRDPDPNYQIFLPDPSNLLEIHFSVHGPQGTLYEGGIYHGLIMLDPDHPFKPPHIQMLTPSGRFETHKNICFSFTAYHPETWSPACKLRDIIIGLSSMFDATKEVGLGFIQNPNPSDVVECREKSRTYQCTQCSANHSLLSSQ
ncbi:Ubiquitin-conjugating enzyme E2-28.4 kDa [Giardia muris]|uniref:Ubiquitin-conjugating enzyme E2-28.4 kDa n=1 Tax=Giardia muris TaxID=5742 RepID=A0A4Z1SXG6_GIAMU|nr:Ubiquitin-conjugating enzyme E2-28.4 kDa [Giardia muris]|eukprot:TNJ30220.1 Ubiquitin-conjugating enzyme E2-28.4 kDa [Giardia muris]